MASGQMNIFPSSRYLLVSSLFVKGDNANYTFVIILKSTKTSIMRKLSIALVLFAAVFLFQFCSSSKKTTAAVPPPVNFESNVKPMILASCGPCHVAGQGNKKSLDNFANAKEYADDIIARIQKNPGERGFMPMRHDKLSDSAIAFFTEWKKAGLLEK
jgi:cytochrome c553